MDIRILDRPFDPAAEIAGYQSRCNYAGGIVSFTGQVRGHAATGKVSQLILEHYPRVTERSIAEIAKAACARWAIDPPLIIHRVGILSVGAPIVLVCTSAAHRRDAFAAADYLMDYLKTEAVFWKKEITDQGAQWIEPRPADYDDAARWKED